MSRDLQYTLTPGVTAGAAGATIIPTTLNFVDPAPSQNSRYVVFADCVCNNAFPAAYDVYLTQGGSALFTGGFDPIYATDWASFPMARFWNQGDISFELEISPASGVQSARQCAIVAMALDDLDVVEDVGGTTVATAWAVLSTVTVTVPSPGYYVIRAAGAYTKSNTDPYSHRMGVDATTYYASALQKVAAAARPQPWGTLARVYLTQGSHSITIEGFCNASGILTFDGTVVALRVDRLHGTSYKESLGSTVPAASVWVNKINHGARLQPQLQLVLASSLFWHSVAGRAMDVRTQDQLVDTNYTALTINPLYMIGHHSALNVVTPGSAGKRIYTMDVLVAAGAGTRSISDAAIVLLAMDDTATAKLYGGETYGGEIY